MCPGEGFLVGKAYFTGPFAPLCEAFVAQKRATGVAYDTQARILRQFDNLCKTYNIQDPVITKEIALEWYKQRPNEKLSSRRDRVAELPVRPAKADTAASIHCGELRVDIHAGADTETIHGIIQALKSC